MQERFDLFIESSVDNDDADRKKKLIFQYFGRALKGMSQRKWTKKSRNTTFTRLTHFETRRNDSFQRFLAKEHTNNNTSTYVKQQCPTT